MGCKSTCMACCFIWEVEKWGFVYIFLDMVDYCMNNNGGHHFEFVHHKVSIHYMNKWKMKYAKFGKVGLRYHVKLSHINILQHAHWWARFCMKKHLDVSIPRTLFHMCKSRQFYPKPMWTILLQSTRMAVSKVASIWRIMVLNMSSTTQWH